MEEEQKVNESLEEGKMGKSGRLKAWNSEGGEKMVKWM